MESLGQPEYVHVLINHLPLTGLFAALLCLIGALVARKRAAILLGMGLVSLFSLSAWPVYVYGEQGYDRVYSMVGEAGDAYLKQHRELAERWVWLFYATGAAGAAGIVAGWKWPKCLGTAAAGLTILAAVSLVAGAVIADYGGKVRHREFRNGPPPNFRQSETRRLAEFTLVSRQGTLGRTPILGLTTECRDLNGGIETAVETVLEETYANHKGDLGTSGTGTRRLSDLEL